MSGKRKNTPKKHKSETQTKAYNLHKDAVEKLASADEGKEKYSDKEIGQYRKKGLDAIPVWVKALFVKFWFYAAICYFVIMGLGYYIGNYLDELIVLAVAIGIFNDIIVTNIMRFFDSGDNKYLNWMFFTKKSYFTFIFNILYAALIVFIVYCVFFLFNVNINVDLRVEPFLFGVLCLAADVLFISMKRLLIKIISDANNKINEKNNEDKK